MGKKHMAKKQSQIVPVTSPKSKAKPPDGGRREKSKAKPTDGGRREKSPVPASRKRKSEEIVGAEDAQPKKQKLLSRMSPSGLFSFINTPPSDKQLSDIESMGFGGLMKLKTGVMPSKLPLWLLSTFDTASCSLMNGQLKLTDMDVHVSTGVPMGPTEVTIVSKGCKEEQFVSERNNWLSQFGCGDKVLKKVLLEKIVSQVEGGDDFKRNFMVYIAATVLIGVKGDFVSARVLSCLRDLSKVASFNWCSFVLRQLIQTVELWRKDTTKVYKGPIMVLVFIYLDRVVYRWRNIPRVFPTLSSWGRKEISARIAEEEKSGFGKGRVDDRFVVQCTDVGEASKVVDCNERESDVEAPDNDTILANLVKTALQLAHSYEHFSSSLSEAQIAIPTSLFVKVMSSVAQGFSEGVSEVYKATNKADDMDDANGEPEEDAVRKEDMDVDKRESDRSRQVQNRKYVFSDRKQKAVIQQMATSFRFSPVQSVSTKRKNKGKDPTVPHFDLDAEFDFSQNSQPTKNSAPNCPTEGVVLNHSAEIVMNDTIADLNLNLISEHLDTTDRNCASQTTDELVNVLFDGLETTHQLENSKPTTVGEELAHDLNSTQAMLSSLNEIEQSLGKTSREGDNNHENVMDSTKVEEIVVIEHTGAIPSSQNSDELFLQALENAERDHAARLKDHVVDEEKTETEKNILASSDLEATQGSQGDPVWMEPVFRRSPRFGGTASVSGVAIGSPMHVVENVNPGKTLVPKVHDKVDVSKKPLKRVIIPSEYFKSPFMKRNIDIFRDLTKLEKSIVDLALIEDESHSDGEILFQNERHTITRLEFKTLLSGERLAESLIRVWGEILNKGEELRSSDSPLRHFFFLDDSVEAVQGDLDAVKLVFLPILSPDSRPHLFCANLLSKKLEVIHAMAPGSVPYQGSIKNHRDAIIKLLTCRMQSADGIINALGVHEFVPRLNIGDDIDSGIHVMYFMDTYMGKRSGYFCRLSNVNQLKKFSFKVCYQILTSDLNSLKDKFQKQAQDVTLGSCPPSPPRYSDSYLKSFVRSSNLDAKNEIVVDTPWMQVTLEALRTLLGRHWLSAMVIDMVGVLTCLSNPYFLYLPTVVKDVRQGRKNTLYTQYVKLDYMPLNGKNVKKVFFPILQDDHWYAFVCDLEKKRTFVLNSIRKKDKSLCNDFVGDVVYNVEKTINKSNGYDKLKGMSMFVIEHVEVPLQKNTFDCGVHLLKFIEAGNDDTLWTQSDYYSNLASYREETLLDLLNCKQNRIKEFVIDDKKKTTRKRH